MIGADLTWVEVTTGRFHTCARKMSGELWCWGRNDDGELGNGRAWTTQLQLIL